MSFNSQTMADRLQAAADARKAMVERFKTRPKDDDPEVQAKKAERLSILKAREERTAEREKARKAEAVRKAAEAKAEQERLALEAIRVEEERVARIEAERIAKKEERDQRYLARKARASSKGKR